MQVDYYNQHILQCEIDTRSCNVDIHIFLQALGSHCVGLFCNQIKSNKRKMPKYTLLCNCPYYPNLPIIPQIKNPAPKNTEPKNRPNTAMKSPGEPKPFLFYIITPKMVRQYLTVDSSIRQDKSG